MTRMTKHLSFKKHEKDLYDYINDETKVPDSSAFIKDLIRKHIEQENGVTEPVETVPSAQDTMQSMFTEFKNTMSQLLEQNNKLNRELLEKQFSNITVVASTEVSNNNDDNTLDPNVIETKVDKIDEINAKLMEDLDL